MNTDKHGRAGLLLILFVTGWVIISLKLLSPPDVIPAGNLDQFSAERAKKYLQVIAAEPHSSGTPAHAKVRDYILDFCKKQGLETELQEETGIEVRRNHARAGNAQNILARLKGTAPGKSILVMGHYDSQPNTPGASDDGAGVAAMIEVMSMLTKGSPLKNDVLFLFTDLEESGLFGAEAFVHHYKKLKEIGLLMNFESRGNAGVSITFEVSKNNSWLMHQYVEAVGQSFANSIGYEIYKAMPNDSDFSRFRESGIQGFNTAFIDGFTYYHSMADRIENMDLRSLQNHGDILLRSLKHFGNISLDEPHTDQDAIFFNPIGNWLWIYPMSWDMPLIIFCIVLFLAVVIVGIRKERISIGRALLGIGIFLGFLITSLLFVSLMEKAILKLYPAYSSFYSYNAYNATYYLIAITGIVVLCFALWYSWFFHKSGRPAYESLFLGGVFVLMACMVAIKIFFPTGAYLLHYPLTVALAIYLLTLLLHVDPAKNPIRFAFTQIIMLAFALGLWVPVVYLLFVTFSHAMPLASVAIAAFCVLLLVPSFNLILAFNKWILIYISIGLIFSGIILAHVNSGYTKEKPLQTYLTYLLDADANQASWASEQEFPDDWTREFIKGETKETFEWYSGFPWQMWRADAPVVAQGIGEVKILRDSVANGQRKLNLLITGDSTTNTVDLILAPETFVNRVNDRVLTNGVTRLSFWAIPKKGIEVELTAPANQELSLSLIERKMGLPASIISKPLPENMIYGPGRFCNTTKVKRKVVL